MKWNDVFRMCNCMGKTCARSSGLVSAVAAVSAWIVAAVYQHYGCFGSCLRPSTLCESLAFVSTTVAMKHARQPKRGLAETRPARSQCEQNAEYTLTIKSGMLPGGGNADWLKIVLHNSEPVSDTAMKEPWLHMRSHVWNEMIEEESDLWTCRALEVRAHTAL